LVCSHRKTKRRQGKTRSQESGGKSGLSLSPDVGRAMKKYLNFDKKGIFYGVRMMLLKRIK
jgi:hypothetical protein